MDSKTLSKNKDKYLDILKELKKYQDLPIIEHTITNIEIVLNHIERYEKWKVNYDEWNGRINRFCNAYFMTPNESYYNNRIGIMHKKLEKDREYFVLEFYGGGYTFDEECYHHDLFDEFFEELKRLTTPAWCDKDHSKIYYTEENASKANDMVEPLFRRYREKLKQLCKEEKIKKLKEQLAEMEKDNGK